jgi:hypothetical protein
LFVAPAAVAGAVALFAAGCAPDRVEPNAFVRPDAAYQPGGGAGASAQDAGGPPRADRPPLAGSSDGGPPGGGRPQDPECDLNGRWLVAQRVLATAIGQEQAAHSWFYYEIRQQGADVAVGRGLHCGYEVVKKTSLAANVDSSTAWPAFLQHNTSTGRRGTFSKEGAGCRLILDTEYVVRGATVSAYGDPGVPLPSRSQKAVAAAPGWEDWDADGQPGISLKVSSSLASGTVYTCQRDWTRYDGATAPAAAKMKVAIKYGGEQVPLGRSAGSPQAIESASSPSSDPSQHFAWFHRLEAGQASGSPEQICAAVRTLKDQLVPEANQ